jgi:ATP-binding cassette subfamily B protein
LASGKSSLLVRAGGPGEQHRGEIRGTAACWMTRKIELRPGRVAHVAQVPRVLSGDFSRQCRDSITPIA